MKNKMIFAIFASMALWTVLAVPPTAPAQHNGRRPEFHQAASSEDRHDSNGTYLAVGLVPLAFALLKVARIFAEYRKSSLSEQK